MMKDPAIMKKNEGLCREVEDAMTSLLDGTASDRLVEHIANCDRCRDARHEAGLAGEIVSDAGADYVHPGDFTDRLRAALPAEQPPGVASPQVERPEGSASNAPDSELAAPRGAWLRQLRRPGRTLIVATVAAAAAAAVVALVVDPPAPHQTAPSAAMPWRGQVAHVSSAGGEGGLEGCVERRCEPLEVGGAVGAGTSLRTDGRTRARIALDDGTIVVLDRDTELSLLADASRRAHLRRGALVADVAEVEASQARFDVARGRVEVLGTKFSLRADETTATVDVSRGVVRLVDDEGRAVEVAAGQEGRITDGARPVTTHAPSLGQALSWSETTSEPVIEARGLGELRAKKPGEEDERQGAVALTSHQVRVRIVDGFARTEIEEVFSNRTDEVLEGIYRFPLPPGAQIERLALEVDGELEEGAFVDRERAAAIWRGAIVNAAPNRQRPREEIVWVPGPWKDPALLEWQRGGRFELRIFPIAARSARRIVLSYTEALPATAGRRRYTYPLPHDRSGELTVDRFELDLQLRGHESSAGISASGYELQRQDGEVTTMQLARRDFVPTGDLVVEFASADRDAQLSAWAYRPQVGEADEAAEAETTTRNVTQEARAAVESDAPYLALALRPELPKVRDEAERGYVIVVDASRSMFGERYRRATALAGRIVRELGRLDRVTVLACDTTCRRLSGAWRTPSQRAAGDVEEFLTAIEPEGASDPTAAVETAAALTDSAEGRRLEVVYIGDGTPTVGPIRPGLVALATREALPSDRGRLTTVAVGADADAAILAAMARAGGGVQLPYLPGQRLAEAAYDVLSATLGHALRDVTIELPEGAVAVAPRQLDTLAAGGELLVTARLERATIEGDVVLRGRIGERPFERRYPLSLSASTTAGNAFVPRLFAAARIADLELDGSASARAEAVAWSGAFNVASRYTSLLVLESPAMFRAFGLDNERRVDVWTGDSLATASTTSADASLAPALPGAGAAAGPLEKSARGRPQSAAPRPRPASAPRLVVAEEATSEPAQERSRESEPVAKSEAAKRPARRPPRPGGRVPMRRVWERTAQVFAGRVKPTTVTAEAIAKAEQALREHENRRAALADLFVLQARGGDLDGAEELAERWAEKEALDPDALTARADVTARRGDRERAIRILGSVIDVRPDSVPAQERLARLYRWWGKAEQACRYSMAIAQVDTKDGEALAKAVRCGRATGASFLADELLRGADEEVRRAAERALAKGLSVEPLRGELKLTATWQAPLDVDLALIDPNGRRVSWLGAPTRGIISAADVAAPGREQLALLGTIAGEYVIEVVRAHGRGQGPVSGEVLVEAPGGSRRIPFRLEGQRAALGTVHIGWKSRLVPF